MDADITIANCRLKIVRRGGWSWGTGRHEIARRVAAVLPELILQRIAAKLQPDNLNSPIHAEIDTVVSLRLRVKRKDLLPILQLEPASSGLLHQSFTQMIDEAIASCGLESRIQQATTHSRTAKSLSYFADPQGDQADKELQSTGSLNDSVRLLEHSTIGEVQQMVQCDLVQLLEKYFRLGALASFLKQLSIATLIHWDRALLRVIETQSQAANSFRSPRSSSSNSEHTESPIKYKSSGLGFGQVPHENRAPFSTELESIVLGIAQSMPKDTDIKARLSYRIHTMMVVCSQLDSIPAHGQLRRLLDQHLSIQSSTVLSGTPIVEVDVPDTPGQNRSGSSRTVPPTVSRTRNELATTHSPHSPRNRIWQGEVQLDSVLHFLLLGPLNQAGYLDTLAVALDAAGLADDSQGFAFALGMTILSKFGRSSSTEFSASRAAAAFAGDPNHFHSTSAMHLAANAEMFVSALNAQLTNELLANRSPTLPLVLASLRDDPESRLLLIEPDGMFPVAVLKSFTELEQILFRNDSQLLLIPAELASGELLEFLSASGHRFVIDSPPVRGESFRCVRDRTGKRFWTNDTATNNRKLAKIAVLLDDCTQTMTEVWNGLGDVLVGDAASASTLDWDETLRFAAGVGLAQIAWQLWHDREPTYPLLAIERLGDLSGVVTFSSDAVVVKLPLGRRASDLASHGLLEDIPFVPWFDGRRLSFSQG